MNDLNLLLDQSSYLRLIADNSSNTDRATYTLPMSSQKVYDHTEYVSCIKIGGRPILPPVMTPGRRLECLEWKRKALDVEEKMGAKRREKILATIRSLKTSRSSVFEPVPTRPSSAPIEDSLSNNSTVDKEFDANESVIATEMHTTIRDHEVSLDIDQDKILHSEKINTASVEESHNIDSGIMSIDQTEENYDKPDLHINKNNCLVDNRELIENIDYISDNEETPEDMEEQDKMVSAQHSSVKRERRGSYTLDEPSPLLLAYMERFGQNFDGKTKPVAASSSTSYSTNTFSIHADTQISTPEVSQLNTKNEHLNDYLSQLSHPPSTELSVEQIGSCEVGVSDNPENKDEIVTTPQTFDGVCLQKVSLEEQDSPIPVKASKEDGVNDTLKIHTDDSVQNKDQLHEAPFVEAPKQQNHTSHNDNSLSWQIKKLSNVVQNEAHLIQRRILSLEESRVESKNERSLPQTALKINIPTNPPNLGTESTNISPNLQKTPNVSPSIASIASSLQESMSIRVPSSRGPKGLCKEPASTENEFLSTVMDLSSKKHESHSKTTCQPKNGSKSINSNSPISTACISSRQNMELAVSSLAKTQQQEVQRLMTQQEKDRQELKILFEQQQRRLIQELLIQFNSRSTSPSSTLSTTMEEGRSSSAITKSQLQNVSFDNSSDGSTIEASVASMYIDRDAKLINDCSQIKLASSAAGMQTSKVSRKLTYKERSPERSIRKGNINSDTSGNKSSHLKRSTSPVVPALPMYLRPESRILPANFQVPEEVFTDERLRAGFCRFSAVIKGYLTRRLLRTDRVQRIIGSMRDTMTIALQLHREANQSKISLDVSNSGTAKPKRVSINDVELHRRLLQQLFQDSQEFHNMFFKLTTSQRMNVIKLDTEKKEGRSRIALYGPNKFDSGQVNHASNQQAKEKRLSSATKARIEQKQLIQQMLLKSTSNSSNKKITTGRRISSASSVLSSQRREITSRISERPKSTTPRGRQRFHYGKSNAFQRYKAKTAAHYSLSSNRLSNNNSKRNNGTSPLNATSQLSRRKSTSALLTPSLSQRSNVIVGHTKSIINRPIRKKRRAKSAIGSFSLYSNPSKVVAHNRPWK